MSHVAYLKFPELTPDYIKQQLGSPTPKVIISYDDPALVLKRAWQQEGMIMDTGNPDLDTVLETMIREGLFEVELVEHDAYWDFEAGKWVHDEDS